MHRLSAVWSPRRRSVFRAGVDAPIADPLRLSLRAVFPLAPMPLTTATHRRDSARSIPAGADAPAANWPRDIRPLCFRRRGCPLCRARPAAAAARSIPAGADVRITRTRGFSAAVLLRAHGPGYIWALLATKLTVLLRAHGPRCTIAVPRAPAAGSSVRARTAPSMAVSEHRSRPFARASTARGMRRRAMRASARRTHAPRAAGCGIREEASAGVAFRDPSLAAPAQSPVQATASRRSMKSFQPTASRKAKRSGT